MKYNVIYINHERYYSIGIDSVSGQHVIEVVIPSIGVYSLYFKLTPEEIELFEADPTALDRLALDLAADKGENRYSDRLIRN